MTWIKTIPLSQGDQRLKKDVHAALLTVADRVIVEYAIQVTKDATAINCVHHERLRVVGFDDTGIL